MSQIKPKLWLMMLYFSGAGFLVWGGRQVVLSGFEGFQWYRGHVGWLVPIPSEELYLGTGNFLMVVGVLLILAGLVELFFCPSCPFPLHRKWESPTLRR